MAITFDDGFADTYDTALPLLQESGLTAAVFPIGSVLTCRGRNAPTFYWTRNAEPSWLEPAHIREMRAAGFEVGAHTFTHPRLVDLSSQAIREELTRGKAAVEEALDEPVEILAYPFGKPGRHYGPDAVSLAQTVGFGMALTTVHRSVRPNDDPLQVPRLNVADDSVADLRDSVSGLWDILGWWHEHRPASRERARRDSVVGEGTRDV